MIVVPANGNYFRLEVAVVGSHPPPLAEIMGAAQPVVAWQVTDDGVCLPLTPVPRDPEKQVCAVLAPSGVITEGGQAYRTFDAWHVALAKRFTAAKQRAA